MYSWMILLVLLTDGIPTTQQHVQDPPDCSVLPHVYVAECRGAKTLR